MWFLSLMATVLVEYLMSDPLCSSFPRLLSYIWMALSQQSLHRVSEQKQTYIAEITR